MKLLPLMFGLVLASCASAPSRDPLLGEPLSVNGKRVGDDELELALIYGPGRLLLELRTTALLVEDEIARQSEEKAEAEVAAREKALPFPNPAARTKAKQAALARCAALLHDTYRISDAEFDAEYKHTLDDFKQSYPTLDSETEIARAFRSVDWYRLHLRRTMEFDRVFLPPNPDEWPKTTIEAIKADPGGGELLLPDAKESYQARLKASGQHTGEAPREDPLYLTFIRQIVRDAVVSVLTIKKHPDGIRKGLALWVDTNGDGRPELELTIEELWREVRKTISATDVSEAKQWFVTAWATRDRLESEGGLLSREEAKEALALVFDDFSGTPENLATNVFHFPSVESFSEFHTLRKGFERRIAPKLVDGPNGELSPVLAEYLPSANQVFGLASVECEVLLVSAMDQAHFHWKEDGWNLARRKAQEFRELCDRDPSFENWTKLRKANCEFWDPPMPLVNKSGGSTDYPFKREGEFGARYRNDLINYLGETAYTEWVTGESITDRIFFDQPEGTVAGPFRGPLGWYLTRVNKRTPPARPLDLSNERLLELLKEDYLRSAFIQYSKEAVAQADIRGFRPL